ncbi:amidase [Streptomyces sp. AS02]|uniref:amidase n=1 Tax=Streptomyces sp. AS02 TaxID=2938946 RepID=UPI0020216F11|nr:amidase [Streptomyces sp. AS02]MCL8015553.1 amidase [Streptomyces sp. AS02]
MIVRRTLLIASTAIAAVASMATMSAVARSRTGGARPPRSDLHLAPAREQLEALRRRTITSRALLERYLQHIADTNPGLNAVITLDADAARAAADEADRHMARTGKPLGPLHGLPLTVKDALETKGLRTTCGSPDLAAHVPEQDADAVARLRSAGAVIVGKTNVPVMCQDLQTSNPVFGTTKNPYDDAKTAGGSSGGPAAAVASGMTSLELGSDLAGSLRLPAAYCGVYALRTSGGIVPTRGHIPRPPGWLTSSDMLSIGPLARNADDLDSFLQVLAAPAPADADAWRIELPAPRHGRLADYRFGLWLDDPYCHVDEHVRRLLEQVSDLLRSAGATVDGSTRPVQLADSDRLFQQLLFATASATATDAGFADDIAAADGVPADDPSGLFLHSRTMRHRDWLRANEEREKLRDRWADYFASHDVLITPAVPSAAVDDQTSTPVPQRFITVDGERRPYFDQTAWLNLAGHVRLPALVMPAGKTADGLPLALQIIGPYLADRTVIEVARQLARHLPGPSQPPASTS